jgi:hypothetical protein
MGRVLCGKLPVIFDVGDVVDAAYISPQRDVVLALSIVQKLRHPADFLRECARIARKVIALRLPKPIITDKRSDWVPCDVVAVLAQAGWKIFHEAPGPRGEWVGLFEPMK